MWQKIFPFEIVSFVQYLLIYNIYVMFVFSTSRWKNWMMPCRQKRRGSHPMREPSLSLRLSSTRTGDRLKHYRWDKYCMIWQLSLNSFRKFGKESNFVKLNPFKFGFVFTVVQLMVWICEFESVKFLIIWNFQKVVGENIYISSGWTCVTWWRKYAWSELCKIN